YRRIEMPKVATTVEFNKKELRDLIQTAAKPNGPKEHLGGSSVSFLYEDDEVVAAQVRFGEKTTEVEEVEPDPDAAPLHVSGADPLEEDDTDHDDKVGVGKGSPLTPGCDGPFPAGAR
ncbi:unnamed protein product, partial [marine sediment metagenome]